MKSFRNSRHCYRAFIIALLLLAFGCASPKSAEMTSAGEEEAYIDLRQGFSLVIPIAWTRGQVPVSSPAYRSDTVRWTIPGPTGGANSLAVKTLPLMDIAALHQTLLKAAQAPGTRMPTAPLNFKHPAGTALRLDISEETHKVILVAILGPQRSYLLNFRLANDDYTQLLTVIEKSILHFSIL